MTCGGYNGRSRPNRVTVNTTPPLDNDLTPPMALPAIAERIQQLRDEAEQIHVQILASAELLSETIRRVCADQEVRSGGIT